MSACVYVIGPEGGPWKVGHTVGVDAKRRLRALQTLSVHKLEVGHVRPTATKAEALAVERYAHSLMKEAHLRGEWFATQLDEIMRILDQAATDVAAGKRLPRLWGGPGRPRIGKQTIVRLPEDARDRINEIAGPNRMAVFIREAIEAELERRERGRAKE